jgi:hypothetical protein
MKVDDGLAIPRRTNMSPQSTEERRPGSPVTRTVVRILVAAIVSLTGVARATDGLTISDGWEGTWEVTLSYRDRLTHELLATDRTRVTLCPGQGIVPEVPRLLGQCSGAADGELMDVFCRAKVSARPGCNLFAEAYLQSNRRRRLEGESGGQLRARRAARGLRARRSACRGRVVHGDAHDRWRGPLLSRRERRDSAALTADASLR